jgi:hypothetical protein
MKGMSPVASGRPTILASDARTMNDAQATKTTSAAASAAVPASPPRPIDAKALAVALAGIRADSAKLPETYLRDTVVPHGGE